MFNLASAVALVLFVVLTTTITYFGYRWYARPARIYDQVGPGATVEMPLLDPADAPPETALPVRILHTVGEKVPVSPESALAIRRDLIAAGYRSASAFAVFYGIRVLLTAALVFLAFTFRTAITDNAILRIVIVVAAGVAGWMGPSLYLEHLVATRQEDLRFSLPDALDLMVVSVEAGLAMDQAIQYVAKEVRLTHRALAEELALVTLEMRAGKRRADALRNLVQRTGESETRKLVATLIQTDRFGTSIADALRTHADFMRVRRRQDAEERAGKVAVKLVFPIFFFILPAMLVVSAGPGLLQVFKYLFPMMREAGQVM